jgi:hypothetical protein
VNDLTLDEKTSYAANRATQIEADKHFYDAAQPFYPFGFSVGYRNPGHWDIYAEQCPGKASELMLDPVTLRPGGAYRPGLSHV